MRQRKFEKAGYTTSEIGLGCWQLGGDFGPVEDDRAFQILEAAVDNGINFFDTADVYGNGRSERLIGEYFREQQQKPLIATKYGRSGDVYPDKYSEDSLRRHVEEALERLNVECLDLLQLHCVPLVLIERQEIFDWLRRIQEEGLITAFGASVESIAEAMACLEQPDVVSLQIIFNIFRQKPLQQIMPKALEQNVAIIVRLPLASGLLSGRFTADTQFAETDHRHYNRNGEFFSVGETLAGIPLETGVALVEELKTLLPQERTLAASALRWILDYPAVTTIIAGASNPNQVAQNAMAASLPPLDPEIHARLAAFYKEKVAPHVRADN